MDYLVESEPRGAMVGADLRDGTVAAAARALAAAAAVVAARYGSDTAEEPQGEAYVHFSPPFSPTCAC